MADGVGGPGDGHQAHRAVEVGHVEGDFGSAVKEWEKLLSLLEPGSEDARMTQENLDDARERSHWQVRQKPVHAPAFGTYRTVVWS